MIPYKKMSGLVFFLFIVCNIQAQQIHGTVYDSKTKLPLGQVIISYNNNQNQVLSEVNGHFNLPSTVSGNITLLFRKLGYANYRMKVSAAKLDSTGLSVYMTEKPIDLKEVRISADKVSPVVQDKHFFVLDYFIVSEDRFLLITSREEGDVFNIDYATLDGKILSRKTITGEGLLSFFNDCSGNLHVLSSKYSRQVYPVSDSLVYIYDPVPIQQFESIVKPCIAKVNHEFFFEKYNETYTIPGGNIVAEGSGGSLPAGAHAPDIKVNSWIKWIYKLDHKRMLPIQQVTYDAGTMEMFVNEEKDEKKKLLIMNNYNGRVHPEADRIIAYQTIFKKIYAPVFVRNDSLILLDIPVKEIQFYNPAGKQTGIAPFSFPGKGDAFHNTEFIQDRVTRQVYLHYTKNDTQYLRILDVTTGTYGKETAIKYPNATCIQVYNGDAYYLLRGHDWDDTSYLYHQEM